MNQPEMILNFPGCRALFKYNKKITAETEANDTKNVTVIVPLKYLSTFCRTLEMPLINCETNPILTWSTKYVVSYTANQETMFPIADTKFFGCNFINSR